MTSSKVTVMWVTRTCDALAMGVGDTKNSTIRYKAQQPILLSSNDMACLLYKLVEREQANSAWLGLQPLLRDGA